ncbi:MAG TPA: hypothetical protein VFX03_15195, partial [Thermomicrobiales bacterium]|nr:hypothetical protein [Thermomicrobiales bacterium]
DTVAVADLRLTDAAGAPLAGEVATFPDRIDCATRLGRFRICFADPETLVVVAPPVACGISFTALAPAAGDELTGVADRAVVWRTTDAATCDDAEGAEGTRRIRCRFAPAADAALAIRVGPGDLAPAPLPAAAATLAAARDRWRDWFAAAPEVAAPYRAQAAWAWWVLRANQIRLRFDPRWAGVAPSKIGYVAVWNWDSCFHALALRHIDCALARDQIRLLLAHQQPDGMLPDVIHDHGVLAHMADLPPNELARFVTPDMPRASRDTALRTPITKPPLLAWSVRNIDAVAPDDAFLAEIYPVLVRAHDWWPRETDRDGDGLCAYDHPYSSGLDDSPLWDGGPSVTAPELNAYLALDCDALAEIAERIGRSGDAPRWRQQAQRLTERLLALQWDAAIGLFWASR